MNHYTKDPKDTNYTKEPKVTNYIHNCTDNYDLEIDYYPVEEDKQLNCLEILKIIFSCLFFI